ATPIYKARVQLLIENENPNVVSFKEVIEQEKSTNDYYQTQYRILQSRSLARKTLDRLGLWSVFLPNDSTTAAGRSVAAVKSSITGLFSRRSVEPSAPGETAAQSKALDQFLQNLAIAPVRNSRLVDVEYASPRAYVAASVAN